MSKSLITGLAAALALAAWTGVTAAELFSKTGPVIAIIGNELFLGEAEGHLSGSGTIAIHSQRNPGLTCVGRFTSSAELGGSGQMQCSNGTNGTYRFKRLSMEKGYGTGILGKRAMSFTYGLNVEESKTYLKVPAGKKLEQKGTTLALVDLASAPTRAESATASR